MIITSKVEREDKGQMERRGVYGRMEYRFIHPIRKKLFNSGPEKMLSINSRDLSAINKNINYFKLRKNRIVVIHNKYENYNEYWISRTAV